MVEVELDVWFDWVSFGGFGLTGEFLGAGIEPSKIESTSFFYLLAFSLSST